MARTRGLLRLSGKLGNEVHVQGKYGDHVRAAAKTGTKKSELSLTMQYQRTPYLNKLAGELNNVLQQNECSIKSGDFYQRLHKCFRRSEQNNRFHLLMEVKGIEANLRYPLAKAGVPAIAVSYTKDKLEVELKVNDGPFFTNRRANYYYYELLLLTWGAGDRAPVCSRQYSDWTKKNEGKPEFVFVFPKAKSVVHWMVGVVIRFGKDKEEIDDFTAQAMQFVEAGTLNKKEAEHYEQLQADKKEREKMNAVKRKKLEPVRVKARRVS